jgi:leucyl aminopeptidase
VEAPPNVCTPTHLADAAAHIAAQHPGVFKLAVLEKAECAAMGMGSFLGVAEASDEPIKFIHLTYTPEGGAKRKVGGWRLGAADPLSLQCSASQQLAGPVSS